MTEKITPCEFCNDDGQMFVAALDGEITIPCPLCGQGERLLREYSKGADVPMPGMTWEDVTSHVSGMELHVIGLSISLFPTALKFDGTTRKNMVIRCYGRAMQALLSALANEHIRRGRLALYVTPGSLWYDRAYLLSVPILIIGGIDQHSMQPAAVKRMGEFLGERLRSKNLTILGSELDAETLNEYLRDVVGAPLETYATIHDATAFYDAYEAR